MFCVSSQPLSAWMEIDNVVESSLFKANTKYFVVQSIHPKVSLALSNTESGAFSITMYMHIVKGMLEWCIIDWYIGNR